MKQSKFWLGAILFPCTILGTVTLLSILGIKRVPDVVQTLHTFEDMIYQDHSVTQSISPQHAGLNVINVFLKNIALRNRDPLKFILKDQTGTIIREINFNGANVGDGEMIRLQFLPVPDSAEKSYTFTISAPVTPPSQFIGIGSSNQGVSYESYYQPVSQINFLKSVYLLALSKLTWFGFWLLLPAVFSLGYLVFVLSLSSID